MTKFIEENRKALEIYCLLAKIFGSVLFAFGSLAVIGNSIALISRAGDSRVFWEFVNNSVPWGTISLLPTGCVVLGVGQFLRYLLDEKYQSGWILRNAVKFIYFYAVVLTLMFASYCVFICMRWDQWHEVTFRILTIIFAGGGKVLILVGLAQLIRKVMPVIEESRTLV
jgi:hypothetical protein